MNNICCFDNHHLLHQITCRIHASLDIVAVQQAIVRELCGALEGDVAGLILYCLHNQTVKLAAAYHRTQALDIYAPVESPVGLVLHSGLEMGQESRPKGHPWIIHDLETAPLLEAERLLLQTTHMPSLMMVPLVYQGQWLGTAYVGQTGLCRLWTPDEMQLARLIAEQGTIALHNATQHEEAKQQAQREQALSSIAQRIRNSLDIDVTINTALTELLKLTQSSMTLFAVPADGRRTALRITHCAEQLARVLDPSQPSVYQDKRDRIWQDAIPDLEVEMDLGQVGDRLRQRFMQDPILALTNTQLVPLDPVCRATFQQQQIGAWLSASVWYQNRLLGYLIAICPVPYNWYNDELTAIEAIANQLAIAISHRRLYASTQRQAERSRRQTERLTQTLKQLYATQTHLIQSEKMSSLGQMVAGIAHEINNPINFIQGNIPYLARYIEDLVKLLDLYQTHVPDLPNEVAEFSAYIELEFVKSDLLKILSSMRTGVERVGSIVSTLRSFSRLDEAEKKSVDVHEGLESTLLLLKHRLKPNIQVQRHYSNLPLVELYPRHINQVFMSVLSNAIDAINEARALSGAGLQSEPGEGDRPCQITLITTVAQNPLGQDVIQIRVRDTGKGIPVECQSKVFDPFFTTKPVGTGTGLGLAISYRIVVHQHQGRLWFESEQNQGTEFVIELPLQITDDDLPEQRLTSVQFPHARPPQRNHVWQRQTTDGFTP